MIANQVAFSLFFMIFNLVCLETEAQGTSTGTTTSGTSQTNKNILESYPCGTNGAGDFSLTPELWNSAGMDQYLAQHPTARNQTISQFAASLGMSNFFCGIGLECMAGQLCYPAVRKDYLIIYAIQQWNNFMNQLYTVLADVIMSLSDSSAVIVTDFIPLGMKRDNSIFGWAIAALVFSIVGIFTGPLVPAFLPATAVVATARTARTVGTAAQASLGVKTVKEADAIANVQDGAGLLRIAEQAGNAGKYFPRAHVSPNLTQKFQTVVGQSSTAPPTLMRRRDLPVTSSFSQSTSRFQKRGPPNVLAYTRWSFLDIHLGKIRTRIQNFIALAVKTALSSPIYSDAGIAPSLLQGVFLAPNPTWKTTTEDTKKLGTIVLLSEFFVSIGYVATIGQEKCNGKGPGCAWEGDQVLSNCDEKGVMRAIVMTEGDKFNNQIRNAYLLERKYGYKVVDLVNRAADCQAKFGVYGSNNATTPVKESSPCAFQLTVCDFTTPGMKERLKSKKARKNKAKACREEFKLPI